MLLAIENDQHCFTLFQQGSNEALRYLIRNYSAGLYLYAFRIVREQSACEDIVEDGFITLWEKRNELVDFTHLKKMLYTCVRNKCLNHLRSKRREANRYAFFLQRCPSHIIEAEYDEADFIYTELMAQVQKAIDSLAPQMRKVFIMSYVRQMSNKDIARQLQLSEQTVKNQKSKSLAIVRGILNPQLVPHTLLLMVLSSGIH